MPRALRQWWRLAPADRWRLLGMLALLPVASLGLRLFGFRRMKAFVEWSSPLRAPRPADRADQARAERMAELAAIAGRRGVIEATCLRQALLVHWWLRRQQLAPVLRLGVDRIGALPDMHAWVELDGRPLAQRDLRHRPF